MGSEKFFSGNGFSKKIKVILMLLFLSAFFCSCDSNSNYYQQSQNSVPSLYINGKKIGEHNALLRDSNLYFVSLDVLQGIIEYDKKMLQDNTIICYVSIDNFNGFSEYKSLFYNPKSVIVKIPLIEFKSKKYIETGFLRDFFDVELIELNPHVAIFSNDKKKLIPDSVGIIDSGTEITVSNEQSNNEKETVIKTKKNMEVYFSSNDSEDMIKVYSDKFGLISVERDLIKTISSWETEKFIYSVKKSLIKYKKIQMAWDLIDNYKTSIIKSTLLKIDGLDVIVPTGFWLNSSGLKSTLSNAYIKNAKDKSYVVHVSFSNLGDSILSSQLLMSKELRNSTIDSLIFSSMYYGIDGLNIDFVNIKESDYKKFVEFCAEIGNKVHRLGMIYTVNCTVNDNRILDYNNLKTAVDYFVLLAMDEHSSNSKKAGPVASQSWTESKIKETLIKIPSDNLILAQAAYVRDFKISELNDNVIDSKEYAINTLEEKLKNTSVEVSYDDIFEQNVYTYKNLDDNSRHILWVENRESFKKKLQLIKKYEMAGVSIWHLGYEYSWYWELIDKTFNVVPPH